jgi:hypothetical protein
MRKTIESNCRLPGVPCPVAPIADTGVSAEFIQQQHDEMETQQLKWDVEDLRNDVESDEAAELPPGFIP